MKKHIKAPETLMDITLAKYQEFEYKANGLEGFELDKIILSIFCDLNMESINYIKKKDVSKVSNQIRGLFNGKPELKPVITLDGVEYGFIPELEEITLGEYGDLDKYVGDTEQLHKAAAVMYRPITKRYKDKYLIQEYKGTESTSEMMKSMPVEIVMGALVFFCDLGNELLSHSLSCSVEEIQREASIQQLHNLTPNGDGILQYTHSLAETISNLRMPLENLYSLH